MRTLLLTLAVLVFSVPAGANDLAKLQRRADDRRQAAIQRAVERLNEEHGRHVHRCTQRLGARVIVNCIRVEDARYALRLADIERKHGVSLRRADR